MLHVLIKKSRVRRNRYPAFLYCFCRHGSFYVGTPVLVHEIQKQKRTIPEIVSPSGTGFTAEIVVR